MSSSARKTLVKKAQSFIGVREEGNNKGKWVEIFQKAVDGKASQESWCMGFVQYILKEIEKETKESSGIFSSEHCMTVWAKTPDDRKLKKPEVGCIVIWNFVGTSSGHAGIVTRVAGDRMDTIEGNTGDGKGVVREGDGVYARNRSHGGDSKMKVVGFLKPF